MAIQYLYYRVRIDRMQLAWNVIDNVINVSLVNPQMQGSELTMANMAQLNGMCEFVWKKNEKKNIWLSEYDPNGLIKCVHGDDWNSQQMNE